MLARRPLANYSLSTERRTSRGTVNLLLWGATPQGVIMLTLLNLLSAVALLIWGTHIVRTGILRVYGTNLRHVISHNMANRWLAFASGIAVTAMVQSSNATAMLVTSFVGQGLMALTPALGGNH